MSAEHRAINTQGPMPLNFVMWGDIPVDAEAASTGNRSRSLERADSDKYAYPRGGQHLIPTCNAPTPALRLCTSTCPTPAVFIIALSSACPGCMRIDSAR